MMHGREKSKSLCHSSWEATNKATTVAAEPVERRAGAKGNASQQSTGRARTGQTVHRRWSAYGEPPSAPHRHSHPKAGAVCGNSARRI